MQKNLMLRNIKQRHFFDCDHVDKAQQTQTVQSCSHVTSAGNGQFLKQNVFIESSSQTNTFFFFTAEEVGYGNNTLTDQKHF